MQYIHSACIKAFATEGAQARQVLSGLSPCVWASQKEEADMLCAAKGIGIRQLRSG